jgi:adenylate kinase family enzyme
MKVQIFETQRTLIIGNSGSGKSTLADQISSASRCPHVRLDDIYWIDPLLLRKRGAVAAQNLLAVTVAQPSWVVEGVFGWLIDRAVPRATRLIWLDPPWEDCRAGLMARGPCGVSDEEFTGLRVWAEAYWTRQSSSSHAAHQRIFDAFAGEKVRIGSRDMVSVLTES